MKPVPTPLTNDLLEDMVQLWYYAYSSVTDVMKYEFKSASINLVIIFSTRMKFHIAYLNYKTLRKII